METILIAKSCTVSAAKKINRKSSPSSELPDGIYLTSEEFFLSEDNDNNIIFIDK
jgi:hypothetical protein